VGETRAWALGSIERVEMLGFGSDSPFDLLATALSLREDVDLNCDAFGRMTGWNQGSATRAYTWNQDSRLVGLSGTGISTTSATYSGLGTLTSRTEAGSTQTYRRNGAGVTAPVLADSSATYTPGVSERRSGTTRYFDSGLKNVDAQVTGSTVSATRTYDAYGNVTASTWTWNSPFRYGGAHGYQTDASGLMLLGHRYYDPSIGRFVSRDFANDGANWYCYVWNGPVQNADSEGLKIRLVGFTPEQEKKVRKHIRLIEKSSLAGRQLIYDLVRDTKTHIISPLNKPGEPHYNRRTGRVRYDPNEALELPKQGPGGTKLKAPPDVILVHELGHAYGRPDPGNGTSGALAKPGDTVFDFENPHRKTRKLGRRVIY
jgi:RHS repeat-associated protein